MDIKEALKLIGEHMRNHGLITKGWKFKWDTAKRRFGCCYHSRKTISLSKVLAPHMDKAEVQDTILHEIAHALVGSGHGHDEVWKAKCREIGAKPVRCGKMLPANVRQKTSNYKGTCPNGHESFRIKKPIRTQSCGRCCNVYNPKYEIKWRKL